PTLRNRARTDDRRVWMGIMALLPWFSALRCDTHVRWHRAGPRARFWLLVTAGRPCRKSRGAAPGLTVPDTNTRAFQYGVITLTRAWRFSFRTAARAAARMPGRSAGRSTRAAKAPWASATFSKGGLGERSARPRPFSRPDAPSANIDRVALRTAA